MNSISRPSLIRSLLATLVLLGALAVSARATVVPAAEIIQTTWRVPNLNTYSIVLHNNSTAGESISAFSFASGPGQDYLATSPAIIVPSGWRYTIIHNGAGDGYGIRFTPLSPLTAGGTVRGFSFRSTSSVVDLQGKSVFFPSVPVTTSQVSSTTDVTFVASVLTPLASLTTLASFNGTKGSIPVAGLVQGSDGDFYGTTVYGGTSGKGTVFKMTAAGALTTLVSFNGTNGAGADAALIQGSDGDFYGTTSHGGANNLGTVFKMTSAGVLTTLVSFNGTNGSSPNGLLQGSDGVFYGTTLVGGAHNLGIVFKMTAAGVLTTLATFNGTNGNYPQGSLIQGSDGAFYGTTLNALEGGPGMVFKMTSMGVLTTLGTLTGEPNGLIQGSDGAFYGTIFTSGARGAGSVFKMTSAGVLTTLANFHHDSSRGNYPRGNLIQGSDGAFYGTTEEGGANADGNINSGTIFKVTSSGVLTTLGNFTGLNGEDPAGALIEGSDGAFYGTTVAGGVTGLGTVFKMIYLSPQTITFPAPVGASGQTVALSATATSGLPVAYRVVSGPATISGNTVTFTGTGTVQLAADQGGNASFSPAAQVTINVAVSSKVSQTLGAFPLISNKTFGNAPFTITPPVASSGLPVTVTVKSGPATISGTQVTLTGAGAVTLAANQAGNSNYFPAPEITTSFVVNKAAQTITFPTVATGTVGQTVTLTASASSGLPITYSVLPTSGYTGAATISGSKITFTAAGTLKLAADQPGNANYLAASQYRQNVGVRATQTITFPPLFFGKVGQTVTLTAAASSGLAITYSVLPTTGYTGAATISGSKLTFTQAGYLKLAADQPGNSAYAPAPQVRQNVRISP